MNAYKLADELQDLHGLYCEDAANMLRQQADRIAELEKAQIKELSDEEIMAMAKDYIHYTEYRLAIQFARAILKKASDI